MVAETYAYECGQAYRAGVAHKMTNADNALPTLRRVIATKDEEGNRAFETDHLTVTQIYAEPWKQIWKASEAGFEGRIGGNVQRLRKDLSEEAQSKAEDMIENLGVIRKALKLPPTIPRLDRTT